MKPERQQIAIAVANGWTSCQMIHGDAMGRPPNVTDEFRILPDYLNSFDAMSKVFVNMDPWAHVQFTSNLIAVYRKNNKQRDGAAAVDLLMASAAEWAEAYLCTLGLWEEDE